MTWAHAGIYDDSLRTATGRAAGGVHVTVTIAGQGQTLATLYSDRDRSGTLTNPMQTDVLGNMAFFAEPGQYVGTANGASFMFSVQPDPADLLAAVSPLLSGSGPPASTLGVNGNYYIDSAATVLYGPKTSGAWPAGVPLIGAQGPAGATGPAGQTGAAGATGATGAAGAGPLAFSYSGILSPKTGTVRQYNDTGRALTMNLVRATVGTPSAGASVNVDVLLNGVSIFTAGGPSITAGAYTATLTPAAAVFPAGSYLTVSVTQVGTTTPGSDLLVAVATS